MSVNKKVIKVEDLRVYFHTKKGDSKAVDGNHFTMYENETLAIVGESGCGKSVTAMSILGLVSEPGEIMPGSKIVYMGNVDRDEDGLNLATATDEQIRHIRGNEISMIFQEPMSSLNPVITVGDQIMENILTHEDVSKEEAKQRAIDLLAEVGISRPEKVVETAPVEELFSNPKHPYTVGLMNSMPSLAEEGKRLNTIEGSVPNPLYLPKGCYFADRCPYVTDRCREGQPVDTKVKSRHHVWCFKVEEEMKQEG